jgi:hypothetical protein
MRVVQGSADFLRLTAILGIVGITGLVLLTGYVAARRYQRRRAGACGALLGGYLPMAAAICMLSADSEAGNRQRGEDRLWSRP